jgi:8-hydroxy-5-deazaflavin:NADPH oxidoreductase
MRIGILGAGNVGGTLGKLWAAKGHEIVFGVPNAADLKYKDLVKPAQGKACVGTVKDAASFGEAVVLAVPWPAAADAIKAAGDLGGKVLVDCTNPLSPDLSSLVVGTTNSAAEEVARWAKGARVVKAFNTIGAKNFGNPKFGSETASMFICGDDGDSKAVVASLARELGFDVVDAGPLWASRMLEPLALLWIHLALRQGLGSTGHAFKLLRR